MRRDGHHWHDSLRQRLFLGVLFFLIHQNKYRHAVIGRNITASSSLCQHSPSSPIPHLQLSSSSSATTRVSPNLYLPLQPIAFQSMSGKENLQLFLSPRLTARSARTVPDEDKLGDLQVWSTPESFASSALMLQLKVLLHSPEQHNQASSARQASVIYT